MSIEQVSEIPGLPRKGGPKVRHKVANNNGDAAIKHREPLYQVQLPGGVFDLIWDLVESRAVQHYNRYRQTLPHVVDAYVEACKEFRAAAGSEEVIDDDIIDDDEVIEEAGMDEMLDDDDIILDDDDVIL